MTRWARPSQGKWKRPEEATSWAELKATLNIPLQKIPTVSQKTSTNSNQTDELTNENRLPEVSERVKKNIQNQLTNNGIANPEIKFNKSIAKESLINQEKEKLTAVKKQINKKSSHSLNIKNKKLLRKKDKIKMKVYDEFIVKEEVTDNELSNSQKIKNSEENSIIEDKKGINTLGLLSKTRNRLKNVREIKTKLFEDNIEDENNLQNENDIEDANDTDQNEIEQNINNHLDPNLSKNTITKDKQIRSPGDPLKNRLNKNKLLKKKISKNRLFQKSSSELKNETLTQNKATTNFTPEIIKVFHNNRYKWVNKTIVEGVEAENPNLSKEDINEILYKMARKNSRKGRFYCWLCRASNHIIDSCPLNKKNATDVKHYQHSEEDISRRCTDPHKVRISGGSCFECGSIEHYKRNCPTLKKQIKKHQDEVLCAQNDRESVEEDYPASDETTVKEQPRQVPNRIKSKTQSPYKSKPRLKQQANVKVSHQRKMGGTVFF